MTFSPGSSRSSARSIRRRFSTRSSRSMLRGVPAGSDGFGPNRRSRNEIVTDEIELSPMTVLHVVLGVLQVALGVAMITRRHRIVSRATAYTIASRPGLLLILGV